MRKNVNVSERDFDAQSLAREDLDNLLLAYCGGIALDQIRVDALPRTSFHRRYDREMWIRWRQSNIEFINRLLETTEGVSARLLSRLSALASWRKPATVRKAVVGLFSEGASDALCPGQIDTAQLFFRSLLEEVGIGDVNRAVYSNPRVRMARWLAPIDPLFIADDSECGYLADLQRSVLSNTKRTPGRG
jgi:hypothetical protein